MTDLSLVEARQLAEANKNSSWPLTWRLANHLLSALDALGQQEATLQAIIDVPYGKFATKGDYAAFIRDLANVAIERLVNNGN